MASAPVWAMDMWSYGCLLYYVYNECAIVGDIRQLLSGGNIPKAFLASGFKKIMNELPQNRISPGKLKNHTFFKTRFIETMDFVEALAIKNPEEKTAFYSSLPNQLDAFPLDVCIHKILPALTVVVELGSGGSSTGPIKLDASASSIIPAMLKIGSKMTVRFLYTFLC